MRTIQNPMPEKRKVFKYKELHPEVKEAIDKLQGDKPEINIFRWGFGAAPSIVMGREFIREHTRAVMANPNAQWNLSEAKDLAKVDLAVTLPIIALATLGRNMVVGSDSIDVSKAITRRGLLKNGSPKLPPGSIGVIDMWGNIHVVPQTKLNQWLSRVQNSNHRSFLANFIPAKHRILLSKPTGRPPR